MVLAGIERVRERGDAASVWLVSATGLVPRRRYADEHYSLSHVALCPRVEAGQSSRKALKRPVAVHSVASPVSIRRNQQYTDGEANRNRRNRM